MKHITIKRMKWNDIARSYTILADNHIISKVWVGQEITFTVLDNAQTLKATIDWCSSNEIDISKDSSNVTLSITNNVGWRMLIPLYVFYIFIFNRKS